MMFVPVLLFVVAIIALASVYWVFSKAYPVLRWLLIFTASSITVTIIFIISRFLFIFVPLLHERLSASAIDYIATIDEFARRFATVSPTPVALPTMPNQTYLFITFVIIILITSYTLFWALCHKRTVPTITLRFHTVCRECAEIELYMCTQSIIRKTTRS